MAVEVRGIKSDRTPREHRVVALAASAAFAAPFRGDAVERVAMRTGNVIDCEEAMIDLTSLRRPAKPAYVAGLTEITRKVCVPEAGAPMET